MGKTGATVSYAINGVGAKTRCRKARAEVDRVEARRATRAIKANERFRSDPRDGLHEMSR